MKQATKMWYKKIAGLLTEAEERALAVAGGDEEKVPPMDDMGGETDMDMDMGGDEGGTEDHVAEEGNVFDTACTCLDDVEQFINDELAGVDESDPRYEEYQTILSLKQQLCDAMSAHTESYGAEDDMGDDMGGMEDDMGDDMGGMEDDMGDDMGGEEDLPPRM